MLKFIAITFAILAMAKPPTRITPTAETPVAAPEDSAFPFQVERWNLATIRPDWIGRVDQVTTRIRVNQSRYVAVSNDTRVPWQVIAALHNMESGGSFRKHLHEGSPLSARTRWVPVGRPKTGNPPFEWEYSARDALSYDRMGEKDWQDLGAKLQAIELYNGSGYQRYHPDVPSPYLWSGTTIYSRGKYIADGKWSQTAMSAQVGCAAILKHLNNASR